MVRRGIRFAMAGVLFVLFKLKMKATLLSFARILFILVGGLMMTGCSGLQTLNCVVSHRGYTRETDFAYGSDPRQKLDVYRPKKTTTNAPVVIFFYGGSWRGGEKRYYRFAAKALTSRGFVVVVPDYRVYPEVIFPKFVEDGASAIRWTKDHVGEFGGDTNRVYLMGHSAGAHIAAMLTLNPQYLRAVGLDRSAIRATVGISGPYDFTPNPWDRPVLGLPENSDYIDPRVEPITYVDGKEPPMLLLQGLKDNIVSPINAEHLSARIREKGGEVKYITFPKRGHKSMVVALVSPFHFLAPVLKDSVDFMNAH